MKRPGIVAPGPDFHRHRRPGYTLAFVVAGYGNNVFKRT